MRKLLLVALSGISETVSSVVLFIQKTRFIEQFRVVQKLLVKCVSMLNEHVFVFPIFSDSIYLGWKNHLYKKAEKQNQQSFSFESSLWKND